MFPKFNRSSKKCILATIVGWSVFLMWFISTYAPTEFRATTARVYQEVKVGLKKATEQIDLLEDDDDDKVRPPDVKGHRCVPNNFVSCDDHLVEFRAWNRNQPKEEIRSKFVNKTKVEQARVELHHGVGSVAWSEEEKTKFLEKFSVDPSNPYHRINQKLNSGTKISVHMINMPAWLIWEVSEPRCRRNLCQFDADDVTNNTDVVLVNGIRLVDSLLPARRWSHQLYIMYGREATVHFQSSLLNDNSTWRHSFNLTATYRQESDLHWSYGEIKLKTAAPKPDYLAIAHNKTKLAVWLVSNCKATSIRNEYVREMKKYIDVDIFGRCGNATSCLSQLRGDCLLDLLRPYKFYLAFENAFCSDYLTEKIFKTFMVNNNIVPVVMGGTDYDKYFPKGSFINIDWFPSARELAVYLQNLDLETYSKYLEVKDMYETLPGYSILCQVCDALVKQTMKPKVYDMKYWLDEACPSPRSKF